MPRKLGGLTSERGQLPDVRQQTKSKTPLYWYKLQPIKAGTWLNMNWRMQPKFYLSNIYVTLEYGQSHQTGMTGWCLCHSKIKSYQLKKKKKGKRKKNKYWSWNLYKV